MTESPKAPDAPEWSGFELEMPGIRGFLLRTLRKVRIPVVAVGRRDIWRVLVKGSGFSLDSMPGMPTSERRSGFFSTRFVAARSRQRAEDLAKDAVRLEWHLGLFALHTEVDEPELTIEEVEQISARFRMRRGGGFTFYTYDEEDS